MNFLSELGGYFNRNELYINIKGFGLNFSALSCHYYYYYVAV